ncbi:MAG: hypothetical protein ACFHVJ_19265 [Aestuariibacter sp.]
MLPNLQLPEVNISLVYPRLRHQSSAAKAFLEEMRRSNRQVNAPF